MVPTGGGFPSSRESPFAPSPSSVGSVRHRQGMGTTRALRHAGACDRDTLVRVGNVTEAAAAACAARTSFPSRAPASRCRRLGRLLSAAAVVSSAYITPRKPIHRFAPATLSGSLVLFERQSTLSARTEINEQKGRSDNYPPLHFRRRILPTGSHARLCNSAVKG